MNKTQDKPLLIAIKQYEEAIAFERTHPWDGTQAARSIPYCFIPDRIKARIEDGRADYLTEIKKLLAAAKEAAR
jgi:hypothetical protein